MTNREHVMASLAHRRPDKIPYHIDFTQKALAKMRAYYQDEDFVGKLGNCFTFLSTEPPQSWREVQADIWQDQFGVQWDRHVDKDIGVVANCLVTPTNVDSFALPDPDDPSRYSNYERTIAETEDGVFVADIGFSLFERAWTLVGMEDLLMAMIADKPFVHRLLDRICAWNLRIIDNACSFTIDIMRFGDDWGQQHGLIMGGALWREFIKPRIERMYAQVRAQGKYVMIHSCGKVDELFPDLIAAGLDVFNPFQPEVMDVELMKAEYGDKLCFFGGISTQQTLPYGTPEQTRREVARLLEVVGRNGGYFASPAHAIPADAQPENIAAMIDVLQNQ